MTASSTDPSAVVDRLAALERSRNRAGRAHALGYHSPAVRAARVIAIVAAVIFFLWPVYWLVITAFKFGRDAFATPPLWRFLNATLQNFRHVFDTLPVLTYLRNSIIISTGATLLSLLLGVPAGYAIARTRSRFLGSFAYLFLILLMIPPVAMLIPFYMIMRDLRLLGSFAALILLDTVFDASFVIWMMRSYFMEVPQEMEEAAWVDGASRWQAFLLVALPLSIPGIIAAALYTLIFSWNDFLFALLLTSPATKTLPLGVMTSFSSVQINWGNMAVLSLFTILPPVLVAGFLNRYFVQGLTMGATKG
jgi:ABC-type glycerol-3-phosphate transport system permease component